MFFRCDVEMLSISFFSDGISDAQDKNDKTFISCRRESKSYRNTTGGIQTRSLLKSNQGLTRSEIPAPNLGYFSPRLLLWASVFHTFVSLTWIYVCLIAYLSPLTDLEFVFMYTAIIRCLDVNTTFYLEAQGSVQLFFPQATILWRRLCWRSGTKLKSLVQLPWLKIVQDLGLSRPNLSLTLQLLGCNTDIKPNKFNQ